MLKKKLLLPLLLISGIGLGFSAPSSAQVSIGGMSGQSKWSSECNSAAIQCDTSSNAYKIFAVYDVNQHFALEASLFSLGKLTSNAKITSNRAYTKAKATGFELAGIFKKDMTEELGAYAKLGLARISVDTNSNTPLIFFMAAETTSTQPVVGLGLTYQLSKNFALRGELEARHTKLGSEKNTIHNLSVGIQYRF